MASDQFMIAPFKSGLNNAVLPFLIPEDAFAELKNAYIFRGRVRKRFGSRLMSSASSLTDNLKVKIGVTDGAGNISGTAPVYTEDTLGAVFTIGTDTFTVSVLGTPGIMTTNSGTATVYTFHTSGGSIAQFDIQDSFAATNVFYTPLSTGFEQVESRLRAVINTTDDLGGANPGDASGTVPGWTGDMINSTGQMFSIGGEFFTIYQTGIPAVMLTNSRTATTFTFNTTSGAYVINGTAYNQDVFYYPAQPSMGFVQFEDSPINEEPTYAFDTRMAYRYSSTGWVRLGTGLWTEDDSHFFWAANYRGVDSQNTVLFVTNNSSADHVKYWDGSTWTTFTPRINVAGTNTIEGCRLILPFKNRLLFFNTYEKRSGSLTHHPNRVRYSQNGSPIPATTDAWLEPDETIGKGGLSDADTKEQIISIQPLRDRIIVFFEKSTWELLYTGNQIAPFIFQRINSELGVESTFSTVLFDNDILGIGNVGIHACNGGSVIRIDNKIPDKVFQFHNENDGVERVAGIRDYYAEMVYWTIPSMHENPKFPNQVLVYNYINGSWGVNDDSITSFGYIQNLADERWQDFNWTWAEWDEAWNNADTQSQFRQVLAGNQNGFTFIIDVDLPKNSKALQITNLTNAAGVVTVTVIDHNFEANSFINVHDVLGSPLVDGIYQIQSIVDDDTFTINEPAFAGAYTGGGTISRVSKIDILTKQFNFYFKSGDNLYIPKIDFHVDRTAAGQIAIDFFTSTSLRSLTLDGINSGALLGTNVLETYPYPTVGSEIYQDRLWHSMYPQASGEFVQLRIYLDDSQMIDDTITLSDFQLHAMSFHASKTAKV